MKPIAGILFVALALSGCKDSGREVKIAEIRGKVELIRNGEARSLSKEEKLRPHDTLRTGEESAVVILLPGGAQAELQSHAELTLSELSLPDRSLTLHKGNHWLSIPSLPQGQSFQLVTPTTVAAVRGTKFYTFQMGDITGTCHCEGAIDFQVRGTDYQSRHEKDFIVVTRAGKTALITPAEIQAAVGVVQHHHAERDGSPLGPRDDLTAEQRQKMMDLIRSKLRGDEPPEAEPKDQVVPGKAEEKTRGDVPENP
ncbi:MAG: FecR domain-containing protein [Spirochaetales bacterium]|nr:FecR domain-containing protein [Spirochaetales bacterium]